MTRKELSEAVSGIEKQLQDAIQYGMPNETIRAYAMELIDCLETYLEEAKWKSIHFRLSEQEYQLL